LDRMNRIIREKEREEVYRGKDRKGCGGITDASKNSAGSYLCGKNQLFGGGRGGLKRAGGGGLAGEEALGDGDAAAVTAGEHEAGPGDFGRVKAGEDLAIVEIVLRNGALPANEAAEGGRAVEVEEFFQIVGDEVEEGVVGKGGEFGMARAADESGEGDLAVGSAAGKNRGSEERAEDVEWLDGRNEHTEAIERMADGGTGITEDGDGDGGMFEAGEW
jgi:hypothetical protein